MGAHVGFHLFLSAFDGTVMEVVVEASRLSPKYSTVFLRPEEIILPLRPMVLKGLGIPWVSVHGDEGIFQNGIIKGRCLI